jgi:nucleoside-diphosphate-sugar epimerase
MRAIMRRGRHLGYNTVIVLNRQLRIFLTGATGYIGRAVLDALVRAGHDVWCLVRSETKAAEVEAHGGKTVTGDLADPASFVDAAEGCEGFIHAGFEATARGAEIDRTAIDSMVEVARRGAGDRFFIYTSGIWVLGNSPRPVDETAPLKPTPLVAWRPAHEQRVLAAAGDGLRTVVVRPGIVCGGSRGIIGDLIRDAHNGIVRVIGAGTNHWPAVYARDLAALYVRLVAHGDASGVLPATAEADDTVNDIVEALATHVKTPPEVRRMPLAEARQKLGPLAAALALDQVVRSPRARALGWMPALRSVAGNAARLVDEWRSESNA